MRQYLQRIFWDLYGYLVWDNNKAIWRKNEVKNIVEILSARRAHLAERVLDAGCGTGNYAIALAQVGFCVTGIDYAPGMLVRAQAKVTDTISQSLAFQPMDLNKQLAFPDASFDHVINISVLQNTVDPLFVLGELWRVLRPGGTFLLLHVPRSQSQSVPLRDTIRYKIAHLNKKSLGKIVLATIKATGERTNIVKYWTVPELETMLQASHFHVVSIKSRPPIIVVAEKAT